MRTDQQELLHSFMTHLRAGRKAQANQVLERVIAADPSKAAPYALLIGGLLAQNGQYQEAIPLYREAIRLNPSDPTAYFYLGVAYHAIKSDSESNEIWDDLASKFPGHPTDHYQKALRCIKSNELSTAEAELNLVLAAIDADSPLRSDVQQTLAALKVAKK